MDWHIITGEYPPRPGGVSDYSAIVAAGLARTGRRVRVWTMDDRDYGTPADSAAETAVGEFEVRDDSAVLVRRLIGGWSRDDLRRLEAELDRTPAPRRLLIQYTPNSWGYKGMNFGFARFLSRRAAAGDEIRLMIHEAFYPLEPIDRPTRWALAIAQRMLIKQVLKHVDLFYVSIPYWESYVRPYAPRGLKGTWLPVVSNIAIVDDPAAVESIRRRIAPGGEPIVGCFSSFGGATSWTQRRVFSELIAQKSDCAFLLAGSGSIEFEKRRGASVRSARVHATGRLSDRDVSLHLQACDLMVQTYPDGISTRRSTIMSILAHGGSIVTNKGHLTEPFWSSSDAVRIVPSADAALFSVAIDALLADRGERLRLGAAAKRLYDERFSIDRLIERLLEDSAEPAIDRSTIQSSAEVDSAVVSRSIAIHCD